MYFQQQKNQQFLWLIEHVEMQEISNIKFYYCVSVFCV